MYDTFDWRLYSAGGVLVVKNAGKYYDATWLPNEAGTGPGLTARLKSRPVLIGDFPEGPLATHLSTLLDCRALIPLTRLRSKRKMFKLLDTEEKTVARLSILRVVATPASGTRIVHELPLIVMLHPVKGYDKALNAASDWLAGTIGVSANQGSVYLDAVRVTGHRPGDYSSKFQITFDEEMSGVAAAQRILDNQLRAIEMNEDGILKDMDSEFLHDFRVSLRRTRSAVSHMKGVFSPKMKQTFGADVSWLASATGPTRDLDVYLLNFPEYETLLPVGFQEALLPLQHHLMQKRQQAYKKLLRVMRSQKYRDLKRHWRQLADSASIDRDLLGASADAPLKLLADRWIWRLYRKMLADGRSITPESPSFDLHDLRKHGKKLRYMLEFFKSLYPEREVNRLLKVLKVLQQDLGDFQDYEVQASSITQMAEEMRDAGSDPVETYLAIGMLAGHLIERQQSAFKRFHTSFGHFNNDEVITLCRKLFRHKAESGTAL